MPKKVPKSRKTDRSRSGWCKDCKKVIKTHWKKHAKNVHGTDEPRKTPSLKQSGYKADSESDNSSDSEESTPTFSKAGIIRKKMLNPFDLVNHPNFMEDIPSEPTLLEE